MPSFRSGGGGTLAEASSLFHASHAMSRRKLRSPQLAPTYLGFLTEVPVSWSGYAYSSAMKSVRLKWTPENLAAFITAPQMIVPGTKMAFGGSKDSEKVKELIEFRIT